jgi:hypothetical protein
MLKATGERCFPGQDHEYKAELAESLVRIERFVAENPLPPDHAAGFQSMLRRHLESYPGGICAPPLIEAYKMGVEGGTKALRDYIDELLAVPHQPFLGLCM